MAGNAIVLKHASNVTGCALETGRLLADAGLHEGLFQVAVARHEAIEPLIRHNLVRAVTLTGSTEAGREVAAAAGRAIKKTVLELGGSDPYVVLEDADVPAAARICAASRLINSGQSCVAAKRFVVVRAVLDEFTEEFCSAMSESTYGDPMAGEFTIGPLARPDLRDELHKQVLDSVGKGASVLLGGFVPEGPGAFYPPTVLVGVKPGMPAYHEELFGPAAPIIAADDEEDAIRIANDTAFGLGAAVFTSDTERGERIAREKIEAGCVFVNGFVRSDPRLPFGGVGDSGFGRELGAFGIREFVNVKTVAVE